MRKTSVAEAIVLEVEGMEFAKAADSFRSTVANMIVLKEKPVELA